MMQEAEAWLHWCHTAGTRGLVVTQALEGSGGDTDAASQCLLPSAQAASLLQEPASSLQGFAHSSALVCIHGGEFWAPKSLQKD